LLFWGYNPNKCASATAYDVADASKKVFYDVGTDNGFTCHHALVFADGVTFNL